MDNRVVVDSLRRRGFKAVLFDNETQAVEYISSLIPGGVKVGFGSSRTVTEIGLHKALNVSGRTVLHSELVDEYAKARDSAIGSDWYISSANAITEGGEIVNIDGVCNRVTGLIYGAPNVVIVAGMNKVTLDINAAIDRVRNVAAPPNARRLGRNTPCATLDKCLYCNCEDCMCNATVIMHHPSKGKCVHVVLINQSLGF